MASSSTSTAASEPQPAPDGARDAASEDAFGDASGEGPADAPARSAPTAPRRSDTGISLVSGDGSARVRLGAVVQVDGRAFPAAGAGAAPSTFLVRRVRPTLDLTLGELFDLRVMPDFGEGKVVLYDAYIDVHPVPWLRLRAGKMKTGVGLQRLQSDQYYDFIERSFPTGLVPNREVGVQLHGDLGRGLVSYMAGVYNGAADRASSADVDATGERDFAGAVWVRPFRATALTALANVAVGVSGTYGREQGSLSQPGLASYVTPGQLTFFAYREEAFAAGERRRLGPATYAYLGPVGVLAEYITSAQRVSSGITTATLSHSAWQATVGVVVTGEDASYSGVEPAHPLDLATGHLGALEVVTRIEAQHLDAGAFPTFADPVTSARSARGIGAGVNWYMTRQVKTSLDYERADFDGGAPGGDRPAEQSVLARLQLFL